MYLETVKLKEQAVRKSIRDMLGVDNTKPLDEQFESVSELPKETKHLYYDLYKKEPQSKEDFKGFEDKILNRIKAKTNESDRVDRAKPTVVNVNNGRGNGSGDGENNPIFGSTVMKLGGNRFYNQEGVIIRGKAETKDVNSFTNEKIKKDVFVQAYWNPNGTNKSGGKGNVAYGIVIPVQGGSFVMRPLGTKEDKTGFNSAKKYLTNAEFVKLAKASNEYFQDPNNRQAGKFNPNVDFASMEMIAYLKD